MNSSFDDESWYIFCSSLDWEFIFDISKVTSLTVRFLFDLLISTLTLNF